MKYLLSLVLVPLLMAASCEKQSPGSDSDRNPHYRLMFYNTENLFDAVDDPTINDEEFLPGSQKKWTEARYQEKLDHLAQVIRDLGGDTLPALVGLCEVENRRTVDELISKTSLKGTDYKVIHQESPDSRGIDVALLYRSGYFKVTATEFIRIRMPGDSAFRTRDILYAQGVLGGKDTINLFVSHWPSRSSGEVQTRPLRMFVAQTIRSKVDSLFSRNRAARIVITGDFNDEPMDLSVTGGLKALLTFEATQSGRLYDLTQQFKNGSPGGTYKYKGSWNLLDHIVVSGALMDTTRKIYSRPADAHVFMADYLMEADKESLGQRPLRTYMGSFYQGGYSDHLPVYLDLRATL